jgi:hypothetical protein
VRFAGDFAIAVGTMELKKKAEGFTLVFLDELMAFLRGLFSPNLGYRRFRVLSGA